MTEFLDFVVERLPPAPAPVLEVGSGPEGGVTPALVRAGYEVLGIDPLAPDGALFRRVTLEELEPRFETRFLEWRPYLYRWLGGPASEALECALVEADAIRALGFRYAGLVRK